MEAVDVPESWHVTHNPDPKWASLLSSTGSDPKWIALSPGGDRVTVRRHLQTDTYVVNYESAAEIDVDGTPVTVERKERAIELTAMLVEAIVTEGSLGVEATLTDFHS